VYSTEPRAHDNLERQLFTT